MNTQQPSLKMNLELIKLFVPIALVLSIILLFHYRFFIDSESNRLMRNERLNTNLLNQVVTADIANVTSDTRLLADYFQQLMSGNLQVEESSRQLLTQFILMSKHKRLYDHIRLLDTSGNEITRVNFNNGSPLIVPKEQLQNKSTRYYFQAINQLQEGEVYISPMDLNIEGQTIEKPLKPTIRFGMALYSYNKNTKQSKKVGLLILNYDARNLISRFEQAAGDNLDHVMLVNDQGYWLISPNPNNDWGFMFNQQHTFQKRYADAWQQINNKSSGQLQTDKGVFSFSTVSPYLNSSNNTNKSYWKIISHINNDHLNAPKYLFAQQKLPVYLILFALTFIVSVSISRYRVIHQKSELQAIYGRRFRQTLEDIQLIAVTIDEQGIITFCNERLLHLTGRTSNETIGSSWYQLFLSQENRQIDEFFISSVLKTNQPPTESHDSQILDCEGNALLIKWSTTPIQDTDGTAIGITLIGENITDKRKNEEQLQTLSRAVEQSPSTVMITDTNGYIEYVNKKFQDLTGYAPEEVIGKKPSILKSGATSQSEYKQLWETICEGHIWRGELKNRKKNGDYYWEEAIISPVRNAAGQIIHFISLKEDVTERKRLEETLIERNQEIVRSRELAAVGKMANMIAHDLRNPLSSIKVTLQMIGKSPQHYSAEQIQELTQISLEQTRYMELIITDVMNYSRPDALKQEWLSAPQLIDKTLMLLQRSIDEHKAEINTYYQPGLPTIYADPGKLQQVISNLISNSMQSVDEHSVGGHKSVSPHIIISVSLLITDSGSKIKIEIKDNGIGIDPCLKGKAFEPFYTKKAKGTGLGLAIVKRFIEQHNGIVTLNPIAGGGSCATIQLPVLPQEENTAINSDESYVGQI